MQMPTRKPDVQRCIQECQMCHAICVETVTHCLTVGGALAQPRHIAVLLDCAETCHVSTDSMFRGSAIINALCAACAEVCEACALECERFPDDKQMKDCAERCLRCADACRNTVSSRP